MCAQTLECRDDTCFTARVSRCVAALRLPCAKESAALQRPRHRTADSPTSRAAPARRPRGCPMTRFTPNQDASPSGRTLLVHAHLILLLGSPLWPARGSGHPPRIGAEQFTSSNRRAFGCYSSC